MELTVKVNLVSLSLEFLVDFVEHLNLKHEVAHIVDRSLKVANGRLEPLKNYSGAIESDLRDELLYLILQFLGSRSEVGLNLLGVQMEQADICDTWQLGLEMGRVVLEQGKCVLEGLH